MQDHRDRRLKTATVVGVIICAALALLTILGVDLYLSSR